MKSNELQITPVFDRYKGFGHDDLTVKHCYFTCSRLPDVDRIKIFHTNDQATKYCFLSYV